VSGPTTESPHGGRRPQLPSSRRANPHRRPDAAADPLALTALPGLVMARATPEDEPRMTRTSSTKASMRAISFA
jgi:hypothetical protein